MSRAATSTSVLVALMAAFAAQAEERPHRRPPPERPQRYSIEQAISDEAQLHTIAFDGLAFLTGEVGGATFLPPGKVSDFFGFQYMRDVDVAGKGHNPKFLDHIAGSVLKILSDPQRAALAEAARDQEALLRQLALERIPLVTAFHQELRSGKPLVLGRKAVTAYVANLFELDAELAFRRARAYGALAASLSPEQKKALGRLKFGDFGTWDEVSREELRELRPREASKLVNVGFMTMASEFFSWYAGSVEADTYFCPERHGTYFGSFYLKDLPAMGKRDFDIPTSLTGDSGEAFLDALDEGQRAVLRDLVERQRPTLREIVEVRRAMSAKLRGALAGKPPPENEIRALGRRYGELDGELAYQYLVAFVRVDRMLSPEQRERLRSLRPHGASEEGTAFLYSDRIPMPELPESSALYGTRHPRAP